MNMKDVANLNMFLDTSPSFLRGWLFQNLWAGVQLPSVLQTLARKGEVWLVVLVVSLNLPDVETVCDRAHVRDGTLGSLSPVSPPFLFVLPSGPDPAGSARLVMTQWLAQLLGHGCHEAVCSRCRIQCWGRRHYAERDRPHSVQESN